MSMKFIFSYHSYLRRWTIVSLVCQDKVSRLTHLIVLWELWKDTWMNWWLDLFFTCKKMISWGSSKRYQKKKHPYYFSCKHSSKAVYFHDRPFYCFDSVLGCQCLTFYSLLSRWCLHLFLTVTVDMKILLPRSLQPTAPARNKTFPCEP